MEDNEFRERMCEQMEQQTELLAAQTQFLNDLAVIAKQYSDTRKAIKTVLKFLAWIGSFSLGGIAIWDFIKSIKGR